MAKDDYHVIVYQILSYLYNCLKHGQSPDPLMLKADSDLLRINDQYWYYVIENLLNDGYIVGITITKTWGKETIVDNLDRCMITPKGIEYLCDNSFLNKAKELLKDVKAIVPFT